MTTIHDLVTIPWLVATLAAGVAFHCVRSEQGRENVPATSPETGKFIFGQALLVVVAYQVLEPSSIPTWSPLMLAAGLHIGLIAASPMWSENRWFSGKFVAYHLITIGAAFTFASGFTLPQCALLFITLCSFNLLIGIFEHFNESNPEQRPYRLSGRAYPAYQAYNAMLLSYSVLYMHALGFLGLGITSLVAAIAIALLLLTRT